MSTLPEPLRRSAEAFKPGDEVFGGQYSAFAQYLVVPEDRAIALKPASVTFEQSATVAVAGITALQTLRDRGRLHAGLLS